MNYQEFKEEFKESGLSQKGFSELKGMSPSMVSYYLSRARDQKASNNTRGIINKSFSKLAITDSVSKQLKIRLPNGIEIEIPI